MPDSTRPNSLIHEQSPYLLQHAYNPVDWHTWSDAAFALAKKEDKPVFVSIGYATCHWCHVMAHESFEDTEIAEYLNKHFVSIKVDREERPDVDAVCMEVCQALTGHGGWPLTIMMDADQKPFFAGTYFPKRSATNRLGFHDLLQRLIEVWDTDRNHIEESAKEIVRVMSESAQQDTSEVIADNIFNIVIDQHERMFDNVYGGFGVSPKFPSPQHLLLLLRLAQRWHNHHLKNMVSLTLNGMRAGGMYDHVGFGFHRYSTDREWVVPHFEKMLYDQAMLMMAYTEAWQLTHDQLFKQTVEEIFQYVSRDLMNESGAFYSAQDADSEGFEGKYYVWDYHELGEDAIWLEKHFSVNKDGNYVDESAGGNISNILHLSPPYEKNHPQVNQWDVVRKRLFDKRSKRISPSTDYKILADWNGLMIQALAKAGRAFNSSVLIETAVRAYAGVLDVCGFSEGRPQHSGYTKKQENAQSAQVVFLDDYAMLGCAALELYQATGIKSYLTDADAYADVIVNQFATQTGRLVLNQVSTSLTNKLFAETRSVYDSAYPSGNSMAALLFAGLGILKADDIWTERARMCVTSHGQHINKFPTNFCMLLCTWDLLVNGFQTIDFLGKSTDEFIRDSQKILNEAYMPFTFTMHNADPSESKIQIQVCDNDSCRMPITEISDITRLITDEVRWS